MVVQRNKTKHSGDAMGTPSSLISILEWLLMFGSSQPAIIAHGLLTRAAAAGSKDYTLILSGSTPGQCRPGEFETTKEK